MAKLSGSSYFDMTHRFILTAAVALTACGVDSAWADEKSAKLEKGFTALFDGSSTDQWMNARSGKFPAKGWVIEDGCLKHEAKGGGGDIITRGTYEQFDFRFEWKVAKGANSGVKYFIIRKRGSLGHEYQVIDDVIQTAASTARHRFTMCCRRLPTSWSSRRANSIRRASS